MFFKSSVIIISEVSMFNRSKAYAMACLSALMLSFGLIATPAYAVTTTVEDGLNTILGDIDLSTAITGVEGIVVSLITIVLIMFAWRLVRKFVK